MTSNLPIFPVVFQTVQTLNVAPTTATNVVVGSGNGTIVTALVITSNDTIDHNVTFAVNVAGVLTNVGSLLVAANTGNVNVAAISVFANTMFQYLPIDSNGNRYLYLANGTCSLVAFSNSVNSTAKVVSVTGQAQIF